MSTTEHAEACTRFAEAMVATHQAAPADDGDVARCACGRAAVLCEVNSAARDAGLLAPVTGSDARLAEW